MEDESHRKRVDRRVLLSDRRKPIDRRDMAFFESFMDEVD